MNGPRRTRKGFPYHGTSFSEDGATAWQNNTHYREVPFGSTREKQFKRAVILVIATVFPGIMLLAWLELSNYFMVFVPLVLIPFFLYNRKIHRCPVCAGTTRKVGTPYMDSPVLFFCDTCRLFFEHGQMDGGFPVPPRTDD